MSCHSSSEYRWTREPLASTSRVEEHLGRRATSAGAFVRNHANAIIACDFFTSVTATFQALYVFVVIEIGSRRILHVNVTDHPAAEWTRHLGGHLKTGHTWTFQNRP